MSAGREAIAHHEISHKVVAEAGGLGTHGAVHVSDNGGEVRFNDPQNCRDLRALQVAMVAGHVGQTRWAREHGVSTPRGDSADRAEFRANNRYFALNGEKPISYGQAVREAERLVDRNWGRIEAEAQHYYDAEAER